MHIILQKLTFYRAEILQRLKAHMAFFLTTTEYELARSYDAVENNREKKQLE